MCVCLSAYFVVDWIETLDEIDGWLET